MKEIIRRPHWAPDLLNFFVRRKIYRQKIPLIASFKLTYHCNLSCSACPFHRRSGEERSSITWEGAVGALEELKRRGTRIVVFEGGEPFLWRDGSRGLRELVEYAKQRFLRVAVTTNGTFCLDVPADVLWVSLDGTQSVHDHLRSGSFGRVWENLEAACRTPKGPRILVHFTMNRLNWRELGRLTEMLKGNPAVKGLTLQLFYPYGQAASPLALSGEERRMALEQGLRLRWSYPILNSARCLRGMIRNDWPCHEDLLINVDPDGSIIQGCYARGRGTVDCRRCGFTPVAEASAALDLHPGSLLAGWRAYLS
ncbi:MAG: radical SAM protein [Deltaproteobacteria bacterium]|nr:radical SAM protein [Deltaproteobacteria bacterium]